MSKNKKNKKSENRPDHSIASQNPAANSAEFVPTPADIPFLYNDANASDEPFDFIPDIKGNKFS